MKRSGKRPQFSSLDRCFWLLLSSWWSRWPQALEIMQADTVRRWKRQGMWYHLRWSRGRKPPGRPPIPAETRHLIREMSRDNRLWGAPRFHGELAKLGIHVSRTTVAQYMIRHPYPPSPTWRTFIRNQVPDFIIPEFYAGLSGRGHAVSTQIVRALRRWLWGFVSAWRHRFGCRHTMHVTERSESVSVPTVWTLGMADPIMASECNPLGPWSSSPNHPFYVDVPIDMGRVLVRLNTYITNGCAVAPNLPLTSQEVRRWHRTDISEQAAASRCRRMDFGYRQEEKMEDRAGECAEALRTRPGIAMVAVLN
jgi:hypothetical protein